MQYDFMKDDSLTPEEKDELMNAEIRAFGEFISGNEKPAPQIMNLNRYRDFCVCESTARAAMLETGNEVTTKVNEPFASMGSISIEGDEIYFESAKIFNGLCDYASNVEAYILTNGNLKLTFTFLNMTKPMTDDEN